MAQARNTNAISKALKAEKKAIPPAVKIGTDEALAKLVALLSGAYPPPSAPGTPPHKRGGGLIASMKGVQPSPYTARIGTSTELAVWLERGTHTKHGGVKMEARPFFVKFATTTFPDSVTSAVAKAMSAAAGATR